MSESIHPSRPGAARRLLAAPVALVGTIVWTHALAGVLRSPAGVSAEALALASLGLTLSAVAGALAASLGAATVRRAVIVGGGVAVAAIAAISIRQGGLFVPALSLLPVTMTFGGAGAWLAGRLPASLDGFPSRRRLATGAWIAVSVLAIGQVARLATYLNDPDSDWFLTTRHPFYAKHECANAYVYAAELSRRGETNVFDAMHYPGLNRDAEPHTEVAGLAPEDPYQYAPQFLLWPRIALALTNDYGVMRTLWFGMNVTLCLGAVLLLARWVGGREGAIAAALSPLVLASFPALHNFQYGQFHFATIALAVLAMIAFSARRSALGGTLLAASILSKLFPGVLVVFLAAQRRWRDLAWTGLAALLLTFAAFAVVGPDPFVSFASYHVPRLSDGSAFAFGETWPEVADLVTAGNQGVQGIVQKLAALGLPGMTDSAARVASGVFGLLLLGLSAAAGFATARSDRPRQAVAWLGLLGLASLASAGAWADYVPVTAVWLLVVLAPLAPTRPVARFALAGTGLLQFTLLGTLPLGDAASPSWMLPLSLLGAISMLGLFGFGVKLALPAWRPVRLPGARPVLQGAASAD